MGAYIFRSCDDSTLDAMKQLQVSAAYKNVATYLELFTKAVTVADKKAFDWTIQKDIAVLRTWFVMEQNASIEDILKVASTYMAELYSKTLASIPPVQLVV